MRRSLGSLAKFRAINKAQKCNGTSRKQHFASLDYTGKILAEFREICKPKSCSTVISSLELTRIVMAGAQKSLPTHAPSAHSIEQGVPIYAGTMLQKAAEGGDSRIKADLMGELHRCLLDGPGVFAIQGCVSDQSLLDEADGAFSRIIDREKKFSKGDHFAPGGKNDRIWNSFQKHAMEAPKSFVDYYSNETL